MKKATAKRKRKTAARLEAQKPLADWSDDEVDDDDVGLGVADESQTAHKPKRRSVDSIPCSTSLAAIIQASLNPKWRDAWILLTTNDISKIRRKLFPNVATTERSLGRVTLDALLNGDKKFPQQASKAITEVNMLFNRTRLAELTTRIMPFIDEVEACETNKERKKKIEELVKRKLHNQEWNRLQKHFGWWNSIPKPKAVIGRKVTKLTDLL